MSKLSFHQKYRMKARRAANVVKDPYLREIAYHAILRHIYETAEIKRRLKLKVQR